MGGEGEWTSSPSAETRKAPRSGAFRYQRHHRSAGASADRPDDGRRLAGDGAAFGPIAFCWQELWRILGRFSMDTCNSRCLEETMRKLTLGLVAALLATAAYAQTTPTPGGSSGSSGGAMSQTGGQSGQADGARRAPRRTAPAPRWMPRPMPKPTPKPTPRRKPSEWSGSRAGRTPLPQPGPHPHRHRCRDARAQRRAQPRSTSRASAAVP